MTAGFMVRGLTALALVAAMGVSVPTVACSLAGFGAAARDARPGRRRQPAPEGERAPARGLARYAGLLQRVFLVLVTVWTVVVAAGI